MSAVLEQPKASTLATLRAGPVQYEAPTAPVRMGFDSLQGFELMQRGAKLLASSTLVPKEYQGNLPNCVIALNMASRIGADPLLVMQNLYVVHGRPGWSSKFLIASFNQCGRFSAIRFKWQGQPGSDEWGCKACATGKGTGEEIAGPLITIALAKKEGWHGKSGSKWQTIPELMLMYRSAGWLVNTHAPEISMGLNTAEELGDVYDAGRGDDGMFVVSSDELKQSPADPATAEGAGPDADDDALRDVEQKVSADPPAQGAIQRTASAPLEQDGAFEPSLTDVVVAIKANDLDLAADLARGLSSVEDREAAAGMIKSARGVRENPPAARGRRSVPSME